MRTQRHFLRLVLLALYALVPFSSVSAEKFIANITLKKGEQTELTLSSTYQDIMRTYGGALSYSWKTDNDNICSTSSPTRISCTIFAKSIGTTEIHYKGEYWSGSNIIEYTCYWFISVEPSDNGGDDDDDDDDVINVNYDDYTLPEDSWSNAGNYTISWYNKNKTEFTISTSKELAGMAYLVNTQYADFEGKTIKLANDIDISGKKWISFGNSDKPFKGDLDGQGYTISGLEGENGLIGEMKEASISNLSIQGYIFVNEPKADWNHAFTLFIGSIASKAKACYIEKCRSNVRIIYRRTKALGNGNYPENIYIGGLLGYGGEASGTPTTISYCKYVWCTSCRYFRLIKNSKSSIT